MARTNYNELLEAGVHFGHLTRKWNPRMSSFIFMERNGIHIIDLYKTVNKIEDAASALKNIAKSGRKILYVATKKQAKDIVTEQARKINMPFVTERWLGGMLTNFATIRKSIKRMTTIDKMVSDGIFATLAKKEKLTVQRERSKLEKILGGIAQLNRLPAALFVVDVKKEHIAVLEAIKLNIPVFGMVDTNSNPENIDFVIPSNDDATKSISLITRIITDAMIEGIDERKREKDKDVIAEEEKEEVVDTESKIKSDILEEMDKDPLILADTMNDSKQGKTNINSSSENKEKIEYSAKSAKKTKLIPRSNKDKKTIHNRDRKK